MAGDFKNRCLRLKTFIGEHEHVPGKFGFQCRFLIVTAQDAVFPDKEIGILPGELLPALALGASHALADQEEICTGDGFSPALGRG